MPERSKWGLPEEDLPGIPTPPDFIVGASAYREALMEMDRRSRYSAAPPAFHRPEILRVSKRVDRRVFRELGFGPEEMRRRMIPELSMELAKEIVNKLEHTVQIIERADPASVEFRMGIAVAGIEDFREEGTKLGRAMELRDSMSRPEISKSSIKATVTESFAEWYDKNKHPLKKMSLEETFRVSHGDIINLISEYLMSR